MIRILDLVFVTREEGGSIRTVELSDLDRDGRMELAVFEGASSGLLDDSDLADSASVIDPGSSAGILIFENRWAVRGTAARGLAAGDRERPWSAGSGSPPSPPAFQKPQPGRFGERGIGGSGGSDRRARGTGSSLGVEDASPRQ